MREVTGHMAESQKPGGTGHFPEHRERPLPTPWVWTQGRAQRCGGLGVRGQPCPCGRAARSQGETPCEQAGSQVTPRRHGPGAAGQCRAPRGNEDQLLHFLRGGSVSCYTWQGPGAPQAPGMRRSLHPRRPSSQTQQRELGSSWVPINGAGGGGGIRASLHPRSSRHTAASPRVASDRRRLSQAGALAAPRTQRQLGARILPWPRRLWPALSNRGLEPSVNAQEPRRARRVTDSLLYVEIPREDPNYLC